MELKKDGVLYGVAYGWTSSKPLNTNLCQFFWRVVLSFFVVWPLFTLWKVVDYSLIRGVGSVIAFVFFGCRLTSWKETVWYQRDRHVAPSLPFKQISWWPKYEGVNISLASIFTGLLLIAMICFVVCAMAYMLVYEGFYKLVFCGWLFANSTATTLTLSLIGLIVLAVVYSIVTKTEGWKMTSEFVKAKKQKVCPLISFVDDPKN